jgi:spheroidene monooxygenase
VKSNALQGLAAAERVRTPSGSDPTRRTSGAPERSQQADSAAHCMGSVAVLVLADMQPEHRLWAWARLVLGTRALRKLPGVGFAKVLGSGEGGGFGLAPSGTHRGLFLVFDEEAQARQFIQQSPLLAAYRQRAREFCVALLRAYSSKGSWDGAAMRTSTTEPPLGPIAALTRASIKPLHALPFWRLSPPAELALEASPGCLLASGLGEAPLVRQATFSVWTSTEAMNQYARGGAHQLAIRTAYAGGYFSESMFVRFAPVEIRGVWKGRVHG